MPEAGIRHVPAVRRRTTRCTTRLRAPGRRCQMFFYVSPEPGEATRQAALAYHARRCLQSRCLATKRSSITSICAWLTGCVSSGFDTPLQDLMAMKAIGLNVIGLSDFHADSLAANDHGPLRFRDQKDYAEVSRRLSDKDFLVVAVGGTERRLRRPLQHHVAEERVTGRSQGDRRRPRRRRGSAEAVAVLRRATRRTARSITRATPTRFSNCSTPRAATGITRTRARSRRRGSRTRRGTPSTCRTIGISASPSSQAWGRTIPSRRCARGAASTRSTR